MKVYMRFLVLLFLSVILFNCKSQEQPRANFYRPVFDQTRKQFVSTPVPVQAELDTTVLIRSNLRDTIITYIDTIVVSDYFYLESGELAIPVELLNAKPPKYDTFLIAESYVFKADYIDVLFPVIQHDSHIDSLLGLSDVPIADTFQVDTLRFSNDGDGQLNYLSIEEILADSTRDLYGAESIIEALIIDAPWKIGDSIPFVIGTENVFLDSSMMLLFDTVQVRFIDPTEILPALPFNVLSNIKVDTVFIADTLFYNREVVFTIFHPDEIDLFVDMVRVRGGTFKIGSNEFDDDERPAYKIRLSNFLISKHEVTNSKFIFYLNDINCDSLGEFEGIKILDLEHPMTKILRDTITGVFTVKDGFDDYPVVNVTWIGAQMFCKHMGGRLPSEAEWEYAARGGIYARRYITGQQEDDYEYEYRYAGGHYMSELGWFVDNSKGQIWVVGRMKPNELGIYDLCGNVWEWCYDKYDKEFYRTNNRSLDPMCLAGPNVRVNRGGSWSNDAMFCRVTNRNFLNQNSHNQFLGFRYMREWR
jgi:formylglycine-generating enzyme